MGIIITPGIVVALKTRVSGGITYQRFNKQVKQNADGLLVEEYDTVKTTIDPDLFAEATRLRSKCIGLVRAVSCETAFGMLCPASKEGDLDKSIEEAKRIAREFNDRSSTIKITVACLKGRVVDSDQEANDMVAEEMLNIIGELQAKLSAEHIDNLSEAERNEALNLVSEVADSISELSPMLEETLQSDANNVVRQMRLFKRPLKACIKRGADGYLVRHSRLMEMVSDLAENISIKLMEGGYQ